MEITADTLAILKNFAAINPSIAVDAGNRIYTVSNMEDMFASAVLKDEFPRPFAIYDLNQFIAAISLCDKPEFDFGDKFVTIRDGRKQIRYLYADRRSIKTPKSTTIKMPTAILEASISHATLNELLKAAAVLQLPEVALIADADAGTVKATAIDMKNPLANKYDVELDVAFVSSSATAVFRADKLRLLPGEYKIEVARGIARFSRTSAGDEVNYYLGCEASSQWENA